MSSPDLAVRATRVVVDGRMRAATVGVRDGVITAVDPLDASTAAREVVELGPDEVLVPGVVDTHVHINEPGRTDWEGFATATSAALAGGVTTLLDMPLNSVPPTVTADALYVKRQAATGQCRTHVGFWGGVTPSSLPALPELLDAGVFGVKCFLAESGVPEFPPLTVEQLEAAARVVAGRDAVLLVHAEDPAELSTAPAPRGGDYASFVASRPPEAEAAAVRDVVDVARRTGCRMHVVHVSSSAGVRVLREARQAGIPVTAETCPHYLVFDAESIPDGAPQYKCCPPIRGRNDQEHLWQALDEGILDVVVSDHSPAPPGLKHLENGDVAAAWGGIASVQFAFAAMLAAAADRGVGIQQVIRWMATAPADLAGLRGKGRIAVGADADLVVVAPDEMFTVREDLVQHRHPDTPYLGRELRGVSRRRWLRGVEPGTAAVGTFLRRTG